MRTLSTSFFFSTALLAVIGCNSNSTIALPSKGYYQIDSLGQLPDLPNGQLARNTVSLVQASGDAPMYLTKEQTKIRAGKQMECEVKIGTEVEALADAEDLLLVQVSRIHLAAPCANSGLADFVEGYVEKSALELKSVAKSEGTVTSGANSSTGPEEGPPTDLPTCESVRYAAYLDKDTPDKPKFNKSIPISVSTRNNTNGRMPGSLWRAGGGQFVLLVKGKANRWKVQAISRTVSDTLRAVQRKSDKNEEANAVDNLLAKMDEKVLNSTDLKVASSGEYEIPFTSFVKNPNNWVGVSLDIVVKAEGSEGVESEQPCSLAIRLQSPLVLDFSDRPVIETVPLANSSARFDLNADGVAERTGWIDGRKSAFLALDLNANGNIDSGRELFGDSTVLAESQSPAQHGFAALAQYDSNADGKIDQRDPVFSRLRLWFDRNQNGRSEQSELEPLDSRKIGWISLAATRLPSAHAIQHAQTFVPNDVRFSSVFSAAGCPKSGCRIYDIFFGTAGMTALSKK